MATIKYHDGGKSAPTLHDGVITPAVLQLWCKKSEIFFEVKNLAPEDRVKNILSCFSSQALVNWVNENEATLRALSWADFMVQLKKNALTPGWDVTIFRTMVNIKQPSTQSFAKWMNDVRGANFSLTDTRFHKDSEALRAHLESHISDDLADHLDTLTKSERDRINAIVELEDWLREMIDLDEKMVNFRKRHLALVEEAVQKRQRTAYSSYRPNAARPAPVAASSSSSSTASPVPKLSTFLRSKIDIPPGYRFPPKLTDVERELLRECRGCRVCRQIFADHSLPCNRLPPDATVYQPITPELIRAAKRAPPIAAVNADRTSTPLPDESFESLPIAAVVPSEAVPYTLGNGSFSTDEVGPLSVKHFLWAAKAWTLLDTFLSLTCLLDTGAHLNCVRNEVVLKLGLEIKYLAKPLPVSLAFDGSSTKKTHFLSAYVEFSLLSKNSDWQSRPCKALVVDNLCTDFILGLPFLSHNKLVVDCHAETVIHKPSGYNLLDTLTPLKHNKRRKWQPIKQSLRSVAHSYKMVLEELKIVVKSRRDLCEESSPSDLSSFCTIIKSRIESLAFQKELRQHEDEARTLFADVFGPVPHLDNLPVSETVASIPLKNDKMPSQKRKYTIPKHWTKAMDEIINLRLSQGFIRPSSSQFASPSFLVPKSDPKVLPRWVCDYRRINENTVPDNYPMPKVSEILSDCARGKFFCKIDLKDSYFQTRMHPDDIHKTAVSTPRGLYEWTVMPMGLRNAPAIQQRRLESALRELIRDICHCFLDDIVGWSGSVADHVQTVHKILLALRKAGVFINPQKTILFATEIEFLGHRISDHGIEACEKKAGRILEWPVPTSTTETRQFLGLVRYLQNFLPKLSVHCRILEALTQKQYNRNFPVWTKIHQDAFDAIKHLVASRECLTVIDQDKMPDNKIFLTTDASDLASGAVLSFGPTWESARPVAYDSCSFKNAELNYPVHEKELLAVIRALKKWRYELVGVPFFVYTDHKTLLNFHTQPDLSRRQARWMELMSSYDCKFVYIKGEDNTVADALSRFPSLPCASSDTAEASACHPYNSSCPENPVFTCSNLDNPMTAIASLTIRLPAPKAPTRSTITIDESLVDKICSAYATDTWCQKLLSASWGMPNLQVRSGLWYLDDRLIVPAGCGVRQEIFRIAHDSLGHFGFAKTYDLIRFSYFWPNMRKDLEEGYIPSCTDCQRNKGATRKPAGPLHPLPVPDGRCQSVAMDFIGPLPEDKGFNCILTISDRLNSDYRFIPTRTDVNAKQLALIFFDKWYCENGLPFELITDRDKLFVSRFWQYFSLLTGIKHKCSTAYHPQTDGSSERTNKTLIQSLRFHVERNQKGWVAALPRIRFNLMCTVNKSTGYSPFMLRHGRNPVVLPPLVSTRDPITQSEIDARALLTHLHKTLNDAKDNLLLAKISQAFEANKSRSASSPFPFKIGDSVLLSTLHRRKEYVSSNGKRAAKFIARYDGPYAVLDTHPSASTVTLDLPDTPTVFPTFHINLVKPFLPNDNTTYPHRTIDESQEFFVESIIDHRTRGRGHQFLVKFQGYPAFYDRWLAGKDLDGDSALVEYKISHPELL